MEKTLARAELKKMGEPKIKGHLCTRVYFGVQGHEDDDMPGVREQRSVISLRG